MFEICHNALYYVYKTCWKKNNNTKTNKQQNKFSISAQISHSNCQAQWWRTDGLGLLCSYRICKPCSDRINQNIPPYTKVFKI